MWIFRKKTPKKQKTNERYFKTTASTSNRMCMAARRCQARAKPKCGSITSKSEDTLANQTPEEKQKQLIAFRKCLDNNNDAAQSEVMCGLAKKPSYVWILDKNIT